MKKILVSLMLLALVVGLIGAGTVAFFQDTETSTGNTFAAGTLDLSVGGQNPNLSPDWTLSNLAPGASGSHTFSLYNVGSLPGFLDIEGVTVVNHQGITNEAEGQTVEGDLGELGANVNVIVTVDNTQLWSGTLDALTEFNNVAENYFMPAETGVAFVINWSIPSAVGNIIQGDTVTVGMTFELSQTDGQ